MAIAPIDALDGSPAAEPITTADGQRAYVPMVQLGDGSGKGVVLSSGPSGTAPVMGSAAANGATATFRPAVGRPVSVRLSGVFGGATVSTEVSYDDGATWSPITIAGAAYGAFTGAAAEPVAEAGDTTTRFRLVVSGATGTTNISYRLGH